MFRGVDIFRCLLCLGIGSGVDITEEASEEASEEAELALEVLMLDRLEDLC